MKTCDYCGKANEDATRLCTGCGTAFHDPVAKTEPAPWTKLRGWLRVLNAGSATLILFAYFVSGVLGALFTSSLTYLILPLALSGIGMVLTSITLIPEFLKNTSPTGAAWVLGTWKAILKGLVIGLVLGVFAHVLVSISKHPVAHKNTDLLNQLIHTPGITQWIALAATALLAPPIEEMLFRGVLYGGYRKSFGSFWGLRCRQCYL
jgi:membrane protease YdiL (CAAX protease family)